MKIKDIGPGASLSPIWIRRYVRYTSNKFFLYYLQAPDTKGTLLQAFEKALEVEKEVNDHLLLLHWEAQEKNDPNVITLTCTLSSVTTDKFLSEKEISLIDINAIKFCCNE